MAVHNCKYYDSENGWCKKLSDWRGSMPDIEYCVDGPCLYEEPMVDPITVGAKYKIGDVVWHYDYYYDTYTPSPAIGQIYQIDVEITLSNTRVIYYVKVKYNDIKSYETYSEARCFGSYEECAKWCEEHNK